MSFVHQSKLEDPVATVCVLICPTEDDEARPVTAKVIQSCHRVIRPRGRHLTEYGQRLPRTEVEIEDADVVESHASSPLVDVIVAAPIKD